MKVENLLLIEDNRADARLVEEYLAEASSNGNGGKLEWEDRLQAGIRHLRDHGHDCVLLDLHLPDSDGLDSVERVVAEAGDTPVIVLTGLDDEDTALRAVQAGADDYLRKDALTPTSLQRAVRYALERRRLQREVREEARQLEEVVEASPAAIASTRGPEHVFEMVNPAYRSLVGEREVMGRPAREVFPELDGSGYFEALDRVYETGERVSGQEQPLEVAGAPAGQPDTRYLNYVFQPRRASGDVVGVLAHVIDVTQEVEGRRMAEEHHERLERILDTVSEGVLVIGADRDYEFANPAARRILGIDTDTVPRLSPSEPGWSLRARDHTQIPAGQRPIEHVFRSGRTIEDVEIDVRRPDGEDQVLSMNAAPLFAGDDDPQGVVVSLRDVTDRRRFEEQLRHRALHDTLTGLPNRALFRDRLQHVLDSSRRTRESVAVFFLDIDRFKLVNDSLGHEAGDRLLELVAERLQDSVREADTVARMGGDEFMVLLEGVEDGADAENVADRVVEALEFPFTLGKEEIHVEASIGIAVQEEMAADNGLPDSDELINRADEAMYRAKETAGTTYRFASSMPAGGVTSRLKVETRLRAALENGGLETVYQPIFDLESRRITGVEALARWEDAELGPIEPGRFIPLAEETGLIARLGRQQLRQACQQVSSWKSGGEVHPDLRLHVNLSMGQLDEPGMVDHLRGVLADSGFPAGRLWLEITESVTMRQPGRLQELKGLGVRLAVDDFGTRYSTLAQLKRLDLDALKIDRTFVDGLVEDSRDRAIVESVIILGKSLGLEVVAEGIETEEQVGILEHLNCDSGQGFLVGRPLPAREVQKLIWKLNAPSGRPPSGPVVSRNDVQRRQSEVVHP